ncbi:hypothetical protein COR51_23710 [Vibrio mediterranei]|uniref:Uncharacterized protein n=1 Tax=Vibrio mediterranei TaxID=689 RepID=A0ABX5D941_9VIBR|nr:hypothetical protein COR51_23710 [Vibrio mediterranei]
MKISNITTQHILEHIETCPINELAVLRDAIVRTHKTRQAKIRKDMAKAKTKLDVSSNSDLLRLLKSLNKE